MAGITIISTILPDSLSCHMRFGPQFHTSLIQSPQSGFAQRNIDRQDAFWAGSIKFELMTPTQHHDMVSFFLATRGMGKGFLMIDPSDHTATNESLGSNGTDLYMRKAYTIGGETYYRRITRPINGTIVLSSAATIDYNSGVITGGDGSITWSGSFYTPCVFMTDHFDANLDVGIIAEVDLPVRELLPIEMALL